MNQPLALVLAQHYDELVDYIRRRFGDRHFARAVIHEVCVQLLEKPPAAVRVPLAFLRQASTHRAIDRRRAAAARRAVVDCHDSMPDLPGTHPDGAQALDFQQQLASLVAIVEALPPRARQVFLLHRVHGMTQREIADALDISRNMVTQHLDRALGTIVVQWAPARAYCHAASWRPDAKR